VINTGGTSNLGGQVSVGGNTGNEEQAEEKGWLSGFGSAISTGIQSFKSIFGVNSQQNNYGQDAFGRVSAGNSSSYSYVQNNPLLYIDPKRLTPILSGAYVGVPDPDPTPSELWLAWGLTTAPVTITGAAVAFVAEESALLIYTTVLSVGSTTVAAVTDQKGDTAARAGMDVAAIVATSTANTHPVGAAVTTLNVVYDLVIPFLPKSTGTPMNDANFGP